MSHAEYDEYGNEIKLVKLTSISPRTCTFNCQNCGKQNRGKWVANEWDPSIKKCSCGTKIHYRVKSLNEGYHWGIERDMNHIRAQKRLREAYETKLKNYGSDDEDYEDYEDYEYMIEELDDVISGLEDDLQKYKEDNANALMFDTMLKKNYNNSTKVPNPLHVKASRVTQNQMWYKCPYCNQEHCHGCWSLGGDNSRGSHCRLKLPSGLHSSLVYIHVSKDTPGVPKGRLQAHEDLS